MRAEARFLVLAVAALALGGCVTGGTATGQPTSPSALTRTLLPPSATPMPLPTPVPIATWVAESVPRDVVITLEELTKNPRWDPYQITITADGTVSSRCLRDEELVNGQIAEDRLKSILQKAGEVDFFSYMPYRDGYQDCVYHPSSPPDLEAPTRAPELDAPRFRLQIRIAASSKSLQWDAPCGGFYDLVTMIYEAAGQARCDSVW